MKRFACVLNPIFCLSLIVVVGLLGQLSLVEAQITFDGCTDIRGIPVASIRSDNIDDIAYANIINGQPVIFYNIRVLSWLEPQTRLFMYAHECAHHVLGHTLGTSHPLSREQEADCWAIKELKERDIVDDDDIEVI
jgi:hypothetical protein